MTLYYRVEITPRYAFSTLILRSERGLIRVTGDFSGRKSRFSLFSIPRSTLAGRISEKLSTMKGLIR